jgi:hypothetical protein
MFNYQFYIYIIAIQLHLYNLVIDMFVTLLLDCYKVPSRWAQAIYRSELSMLEQSTLLTVPSVAPGKGRATRC